MLQPPQTLLPWLADVQSSLLSRQEAILQAYASGDHRICRKGADDIVTDVDLSVQAALTAVLERFGVAVIGEEGQPDWSAAPRSDVVLVDPIDGTENFSGKVPCFGTMLIALKDGQPWASLIWIPVDSVLSRNGFYLAVKGRGAWRCHEDGSCSSLRVSTTPSLVAASVAIEGPSRRVIGSGVPGRLGKRCRSQRLGLSSSWCGTRLALGESCGAPLDAMVCIDSEPWDSLPIALLVEEAGGRVSDLSGGPYTTANYQNLVISNGRIHDEILRCLHEEV